MARVEVAIWQRWVCSHSGCSYEIGTKQAGIMGVGFFAAQHYRHTHNAVLRSYEFFMPVHGVQLEGSNYWVF